MLSRPLRSGYSFRLCAVGFYSHALELSERDYFTPATAYAGAGLPDKAKALFGPTGHGGRDTAEIRNERPPMHRVLGEIALDESRPNDEVREFWSGDSLPDGPADFGEACTFFQCRSPAYDKTP